jgi:hypothetical protein
MITATGLDRALRRAGVPIIGVVVGDPLDRATWKVQYQPQATAADQATGDGIVSTYDPTNDPAFTDEQAQGDVDNRAIKAAVLTSLWGRLGRQPTPAEIVAERTRYIQLWKALG